MVGERASGSNRTSIGCLIGERSSSHTTAGSGLDPYHARLEIRLSDTALAQGRRAVFPWPGALNSACRMNAAQVDGVPLPIAAVGAAAAAAAAVANLTLSPAGISLTVCAKVAAAVVAALKVQHSCMMLNRVHSQTLIGRLMPDAFLPIV